MKARTQGAIAEGLRRAQALDLGDRGYAGQLELGLRATPDFVGGHVDALHRFVSGPVSLGAFVSGWAGMNRAGGSWQRDYGVTAGLGMTW